MGHYKINSQSDNGVFVVTDSYKKLCKKFKKLKNSRGRIIHVIGAPGTGKSANIYAALEEMDLNVYDMELRLKDTETSSKEVFESIYTYLKEDLAEDSKNEIYRRLSKFDAVLFADRFHDSHLLNSDNIGFSVWTDHAGFRATYFYFLCITEYLRERKTYKGINIILQTAWRVYINGKKYDVFTDLGILSKFLVAVMRIFFEVVEISYSPNETIEIVKKHVDADEKLIEHYIGMYGYKPRLICQAIENEDNLKE
jgi:Cdc6-like AAA superfamily ATPase